jgi:cytochrome P450
MSAMTPAQRHQAPESSPQENIAGTNQRRSGSGGLEPPSATFRSALASLRQPLDFMTDNLRLHPEMFRSGLLGFSAYVVHHPEFIQHVLSSNARNYVKFEKYRYLRYVGGNGLVTNEGDSWRHQRQLVQPSFRRDSIARSLPTIIEETERAIRRVERLQGAPVDIGNILADLTLAVAARSLFGSDIEPFASLVRHELDVAQQRGNILLRIPLPLYGAAPYIPYLNRGVRAGEVLRGVVQQLIDARRSSTQPRDDLLNSLMTARDDESSTGMSDTQLRDEVLTLLFGGHETTLHALTWSFYLLAKHRSAYDRLRTDARRFGGNSMVASGELESLSWAAAVAREAMRLYPPVYLIGRSAITDDHLGDYPVASGTNVMINIYGLHRHPRYWPEPDVFMPERMLDPAVWEASRFVYLPFGAGPRGCVGFRLSMIEMQLVLAMFADAFDIELASKTRVTPSPQFTLKAAQPVRLRMRSRRSV